jgi:hypothetical protein
MQLDTPISFSEFILEQAKKLFGSDDLNNKDVLEYFMANLRKYDKEVSVVEDDDFCVAYEDPDEFSVYYALFGGSKEQCEEFITENKLKRSNDTDQQ